MSTILDVCKRTGTPTKPTKVEPITCTLEVVTPMFLAGADQRKIADEGLRSASMKAMLRWWWRALARQTEVTDLAEQEGVLFGNTKVGQGLTVHTVAQTWSIDPQLPTSGTLSYLLGQGLYHHKDRVTRPAVKPGNTATIQIFLRSGRAEIAETFEAFALFGGLGARSRRGFGSVSPVDGDFAIKNLDHYRARAEALLASRRSSTTAKPWSHLGAQSRLVIIGKEHQTWTEALQSLGGPMHAFRQSLGGQRAPYGPDHDLVSDHVNRKLPLKRAPARAAFGIPHNYFFKSTNAKLDFHWDGTDRRASPILLHVAKLSNGRFAAAALLMDGLFLPSNQQLITKQTKFRVPAPGYDAIHSYLDLLAKA